MIQINYLKKDPTTKIKPKAWKQLKILKDVIINGKLWYYLNLHQPGVSTRAIVWFIESHFTILINT